MQNVLTFSNRSYFVNLRANATYFFDKSIINSRGRFGYTISVCFQVLTRGISC